jgi:hypothetical protein
MMVMVMAMAMTAVVVMALAIVTRGKASRSDDDDDVSAQNMLVRQFEFVVVVCVDGQVRLFTRHGGGWQCARTGPRNAIREWLADRFTTFAVCAIQLVC